MSLTRRIRSIYLSQVKAIKDRLDRIDLEESDEVGYTDARPHEAATAREELSRGASAGVRVDAAVRTAPPRPTVTVQEPAARPVTASSPLAPHYRVLGLEDGADFSAVEAAYADLTTRCAPERFPAGSQEQRTVVEIRKRVDDAFDALRDQLDPTAGRFDKLEL